MKPSKLYKTTIVIWSEYVTDSVEIEDLARDATSGEAFCSGQDCEEVTDPSAFPDTEFFNTGGGQDGDEEAFLQKQIDERREYE